MPQNTSLLVSDTRFQSHSFLILFTLVPSLVLFQSCTICLGYTMQVQTPGATSSSSAALPSPVLTGSQNHAYWRSITGLVANELDSDLILALPLTGYVTYTTQFSSKAAGFLFLNL